MLTFNEFVELFYPFSARFPMRMQKSETAMVVVVGLGTLENVNYKAFEDVFVAQTEHVVDM